jgi:hypothetical protein
MNRICHLFSKKTVTAILLTLTILLTLPSTAFAEVLVNRADSFYSDTLPYRRYMQYKMNCYGYASHIYYPDGTADAPYKQQPGEFAYNTETYANLRQSYLYAMTYWNNLHDFITDKIYEDYWTLGYFSD